MNKLRIFADNILAHESLHFLSGVIMFFIIFSLFGQVKYGLVAFWISLLIDSDHYLEGLIYNRFKINWIFSSYPNIFWQKTGKITLLFHSWEFLPAILHYLIDQVIYSGFRKMPLLQYFFLFRLYHRFDYKILCPESNSQ